MIKTMLCDIDGVCADFLSEWLRWYNIDFDDNLKPSDITKWGIEEFVKPTCGGKILDYLKNPCLYDNVKPIKDALWGVNYLRGIGIYVCFVTVSPREIAYRKLDWLNENGFEVDKDDYFETAKKSWINADLMLDDNYENVMGFPNLSVLLQQPHNLGAKNCLVAKDWKDFINLVDSYDKVECEL